MKVQHSSKIQQVAKHGQALYQDLFCARLEDSTNKDPKSECLQTMWKCWITVVPPGVALEPHNTHNDHEQIYYIIEGSATISVGEEERRVSSGDCIYMPPDVSHGLKNDGDTDCRIFTVGANIFRPYRKVQEMSAPAPAKRVGRRRKKHS
jgi:mannose-6-phosphate isomerase-like protein (cupin superfamily)